ncbi:PDR/VanB family oxidoreductase [Rhodoferax saidenbachensis]|uniref:Oxidoreductase n=1 Tax=Rhodoferax saidenbachensis TaxID=1484693 RepID=A0A1P8KBB9_9BURK|nr:PDR/VanB family oxidoreductase [Rhodoferax saidenbachensis]APW43310.1 oxidoreductase [Rhodoferax saidenbachensis]
MATNLYWADARVQSYRDITPTVREFTLALEAPAPVSSPAHGPGAHLPVQLLVNGRPQTRTYSLVSAPEGQTCCIAVKRLEQGRGGSMAMWQLAVGDRLRVGEPRNDFPLSLQAPAYLLVAGGVGVTALVRMAQTLAQRGAQVRMLLAARSDEELAYVEALREALGERLQTHVSAHGERIDFASEIAALPAGAQLMCCGPVSMLDAARQAWAQANRPVADLRFETFGSSGRLAPQAFQVQIPRQQIDITVAADCSLLDAIEMAGVQALSNCRRGECGLCAMDVLAVEGEIDHRDVFLSTHEKQQNQRICICVSRVVGRITLDSAYRPDRFDAAA